MLDEIIQKVETAGEVNYIITVIIDHYLSQEMNYQRINDMIGALECAKLELYRKLVSPYEDQKCIANGEVYKNSPDGS